MIDADSTSTGAIAAFAVEAASKVPTVAANGFKKLFFMKGPLQFRFCSQSYHTHKAVSQLM